MTTLSFYGAAGAVTGSKYLLESQSSSLMIDCGLFQGLKALRLLNWEQPAYLPGTISALVITHAHLDHIGYLPRIVRDGFRGPIYATPATADLMRLQLLDSAKLQEEDAEYANRKGFSKHHPALPLYETRDVHRALRLVKPQPLATWFEPAKGYRACLHDTGHLLGAAMVEVETPPEPKASRVLFSGDVGRYDAPLYHDPTPPPPADYLICESTYGDRDHLPVDVLGGLATIVNDAAARGGMLVVASFAVGRTQQLIYLLQVLEMQRKIPPLPIYVDSPMAVEATEIYCRYADDHDLAEGMPRTRDCVLLGPNIHWVERASDSKAINRERGPGIIIASSGMMTGGRILHHLRQRLSDPANTIVLAGYMAEGTRGRDLKEGRAKIRIHGRDFPVRANIVDFPGMSGHADRGELLRWLKDYPAPRQVFITHGEPPSAAAFAELLRTERGWNVTVPKLNETFTLEGND